MKLVGLNGPFYVVQNYMKVILSSMLKTNFFEIFNHIFHNLTTPWPKAKVKHEFAKQIQCFTLAFGQGVVIIFFVVTLLGALLEGAPLGYVPFCHSTV